MCLSQKSFMLNKILSESESESADTLELYLFCTNPLKWEEPQELRKGPEDGFL